jgi:hypothetical protein
MPHDLRCEDGRKYEAQTRFAGDDFKTSARIVLTIAALKNDLDMLAFDIRNVYLWADYSKVF